MTAGGATPEWRGRTTIMNDRYADLTMEILKSKQDLISPSSAYRPRGGVYEIKCGFEIVPAPLLVFARAAFPNRRPTVSLGCCPHLLGGSRMSLIISGALAGLIETSWN
jgi:hypothetical protein